MADIRQQILNQLRDRKLNNQMRQDPEQFRDVLMENNPLYSPAYNEGVGAMNSLIPGIDIVDPRVEQFSPDKAVEWSSLLGLGALGAGPPTEAMYTGATLADSPTVKVLQAAKNAQIPGGWAGGLTDSQYLKDLWNLRKTLSNLSPEELQEIGRIKIGSTKGWNEPGQVNVGAFSSKDYVPPGRSEPLGEGKTLIGKLSPEKAKAPQAFSQWSDLLNPVTEEPIYGPRMVGLHETSHPKVYLMAKQLGVDPADIPVPLKEAATNAFAAEAGRKQGVVFPLYTQEQAYGKETLTLQNEIIRDASTMGYEEAVKKQLLKLKKVAKGAKPSESGTFKFKPGEAFKEEIKGRTIQKPGQGGRVQSKQTGTPMTKGANPEPNPLGTWTSRLDEKTGNIVWENPQWKREFENRNFRTIKPKAGEPQPYVTPEPEKVAQEYESQIPIKELNKEMGGRGKTTTVIRRTPGRAAESLPPPSDITKPDVPYQQQIPILKNLLRDSNLNESTRSAIREQLLEAERGIRNEQIILQRAKKGETLLPPKSGMYESGNYPIEKTKNLPAKKVYEAEVVNETPFDKPAGPKLMRVRLASGEMGYIDYEGNVYKKPDLKGYSKTTEKGKVVDKTM